MRRFYRFLLLVMLASGCSTEESFTEVQELKAGVFLDSEVSGLDYKTQTIQGKTDVSGEFLYREGEEITFSLGNLMIGTAQAAPVMSPADMFSGNSGSLKSKEVKNLAAFLQSLDNDADPTNGIRIKEEIIAALDLEHIDFSESIIQLLGEVTIRVNRRTDSRLKPVYPEQAAKHLHQTFGKNYVPDNPVFAYLVPAIENWHEFAQEGVHWIHQTDRNDGLLSSVLYDKNPFRPIVEYKYSKINSMGFPVEMDQTVFEAGRLPRERKVFFSYSSNNQLKKVRVQESESPVLDAEIRSFDGHYRIRELLFYDSTGNFTHRDQIIFDRFGMKTYELRYGSKEGEELADVLRKTHFTYTTAGDYKAITHYDAADILTEIYRYRTDQSLEKRVHYRYSNPSWNKTEYYDEQEKITSIVIISGEQRTEYVSFYDTGDVHIAHIYWQGNLIGSTTWNTDGSSETKIYETGSNAYRIEYRDSSGAWYKTEFYDAEGNLVKTEYQEDKGIISYEFPPKV